MRARSIAVLSLIVLLGHRQQSRTASPQLDGDDAAERWFLQQRGIAPPGARKAALDYVVAWRAHNETAPSYIWQSLGPAPLITTGISQIANTGRVTAIAISPADPNVVVVGSSSGGIWRSSDGGSTFKPVSDDQIDLTV